MEIIYTFTHIIDFSFVGGSLKQLLKRVSLGPGIHSGNRIIYTIIGNDNSCNSCCCIYKRITTAHCLSIEIRVEADKGTIIDFSGGMFSQCVFALQTSKLADHEE